MIHGLKVECHCKEISKTGLKLYLQGGFYEKTI